MSSVPIGVKVPPEADAPFFALPKCTSLKLSNSQTDLSIAGASAENERIGRIRGLWVRALNCQQLEDVGKMLKENPGLQAYFKKTFQELPEPIFQDCLRQAAQEKFSGFVDLYLRDEYSAIAKPEREIFLMGLAKCAQSDDDKWMRVLLSSGLKGKFPLLATALQVALWNTSSKVTELLIAEMKANYQNEMRKDRDRIFQTLKDLKDPIFFAELFDLIPKGLPRGDVQEFFQKWLNSMPQSFCRKEVNRFFQEQLKSNLKFLDMSKLKKFFGGLRSLVSKGLNKDQITRFNQSVAELIPRYDLSKRDIDDLLDHFYQCRGRYRKESGKRAVIGCFLKKYVTLGYFTESELVERAESLRGLRSSFGVHTIAGYADEEKRGQT